MKSLNYLTGSVNRYQQEKQACPDIRMIVIYAGDIERGQVSAESDIGAVRMSIETVFLSELNSNGEILFEIIGKSDHTDRFSVFFHKNMSGKLCIYATCDEWGENTECILKNERSVVNKFLNARNLCKTKIRL